MIERSNDASPGDGGISAPLPRSRLRARAFYVGQRIDPRLARDAGLVLAPSHHAIGARGSAVLMRYGACVFFDVDDDEESELLRRIASAVVHPFDRPEREEIEIVVSTGADERAVDGTIRLASASEARLSLVADVLAKSVVLAHYETAVNVAFDHLEPLAESLSRGETKSRRTRSLLVHIGNALLVETQTIGRVEVRDKPDVLWDMPELERLYGRLADEYELVERQVSLERKLALVSRTAQTALELLQNTRALRVEWYIVALVVAELGLSLYDLYRRSFGAR